MRSAIRRMSFLLGISVLGQARGFAVSIGTCFRSAVTRTELQNGQALISTRIHMGLYDTPLPPRPPPREEPDDKKPADDEDDDVVVATTKRLFEFGKDGKEIRSLLPPLRRRLESGVECYFEPTDRLVRNLVDKTSVAVEDACWALEACRGDIDEAWIRISAARRMQLNNTRRIMLNEDDNYDSELPEDYAMDVLREYERRKTALKAEEKQRKRDDYFTPSKPDDQWLPTKNPNPVDDEPWFTG